MISHSYKSSSKLNYKCEFWGPNTLTMEVHMKKFHSKKIMCGLCGCETNDLEKMETFKRLHEIEEHINNDHDGKTGWLDHFKSDRKHPEFFFSKSYKTKELLRNKTTK